MLNAAEELTHIPPKLQAQVEPPRDSIAGTVPPIPAPVFDSAEPLTQAELGPTQPANPVEIVQSLTQPWWTDPQVIGTADPSQHARELDELMWMANRVFALRSLVADRSADSRGACNHRPWSIRPHTIYQLCIQRHIGPSR